MAVLQEINGTITITSEGDIVTVRKAVREAATAIGFGITDVTRIVTAASELARNIYIHAGTGKMHWRYLEPEGITGIELIFEDTGPGIADIEQAMVSGYSTKSGLGMGLSGSKRLMDKMSIVSEKGKGTTVIIRKVRHNK